MMEGDWIMGNFSGKLQYQLLYHNSMMWNLSNQGYSKWIKKFSKCITPACWPTSNHSSLKKRIWREKRAVFILQTLRNRLRIVEGLFFRGIRSHWIHAPAFKSIDGSLFLSELLKFMIYPVNINKYLPRGFPNPVSVKM